MKRRALMNQWLNSVIQGNYQLSPLAGDASFRCYTRVHCDSGATYMLMDAPPEHEDVRPFVKIATLLRKAGLHTPCIVAKEQQQGFLLLQDFGDTTWAIALKKGYGLEALFDDALRQLHILQQETLYESAIKQQLPHFDAHRMRRECVLWTDWYLPYVMGKPLNTGKRNAVLHDLDKLFLPLATLPQVVVHLDFHSRNLMVPSNGLPLGVIDFQDAVIGPVTYDLASLLYDCYQDYPESIRQTWSHAFFHQLRPVLSQAFHGVEHWHHMLRLTAMQRHIKALGIFTRLAIRDGKQQFLGETPLTLQHLHEELDGMPLKPDTLDLLMLKKT